MNGVNMKYTNCQCARSASTQKSSLVIYSTEPKKHCSCTLWLFIAVLISTSYHTLRHTVNIKTYRTKPPVYMLSQHTASQCNTKMFFYGSDDGFFCLKVRRPITKYNRTAGIFFDVYIWAHFGLANLGYGLIQDYKQVSNQVYGI